MSKPIFAADGHGKPNSEPSLLAVFLAMLKISTFTFGGGYAMFAQMNIEFVQRRKWLGEQECTDMIAVAQATPGLFFANAAFLVGHKLAGWRGAYLSALGILVPAFVAMIFIALAYAHVIDNPWVAGAMRGVRPAVTALLFSTLFTLRRNALTSVVAWVLFGVALALALFTSINVIWLVLGGAVMGLIFCRAPLLASDLRVRHESRQITEESNNE